MAFSAVGLSADSGSSWTLPRLVGLAKAKELLHARPPPSPPRRRCELGLLTEVVAGRPGGRPGPGSSRCAWRRVRRWRYGAIRRSLAYSAGHDLAESLAFEQQMMELTGSSDDHVGAVASFLQKQTPVFEGR